MPPAPIALFAYNRPAHFMQTVEALRAARQARDSGLWVFCDGPKGPQDEDAVRQVRSCARNILGFTSVSVVEHEQSLGLAASVTDGVSRLCAEYGRVIVLEDDLLIAPGFLEFMNLALDYYEKEDRVMQISGYMYPGEFGSPGDTLFLPLTSCWGWATWKRAWDRYDPAVAGYELLRRDRKLRQRFDVGGAYDYFGMLKRQASGEIDSWGIRWYLTVFMLRGLVLYPARSLVRNIGVDGSGTHGGSEALQQELSAALESRFIRYPKQLEWDEAALARVAADLRAMRSGVLSRLIRRFVA